jgi:hypothetical protein
MRRRAIVVTLVASAIAGPIDLGACGDKFLRVGRSAARNHRYAAIHPASILIYSPATASRKGISDLEKLLKRAGHRAQTVSHGTAIQPTIASGQFDLVIAAYADANRLEGELVAIPSRPHVLPILVKPTREVAAAAARAYRYRLEIDRMTKSEALAEIDELMAGRRHGVARGTP